MRGFQTNLLANNEIHRFIYIYTLHMYISALEKIYANFPFDFGLILEILSTFIAALHRFWPHNDGNQLSGCQLFSGYDIHTYIYIFIFL